MSEQRFNSTNSQNSAFNVQSDPLNPQSSSLNLQPFLPSAGMENINHLTGSTIEFSAKPNSIHLDLNTGQSGDEKPRSLDLDIKGIGTNNVAALTKTLRGINALISNTFRRNGLNARNVATSENSLATRSHPSESTNKHPLVGIIDTGFAPNSHGAETQKTISRLNPKAAIWQGEGVGEGRWAESLNEFVEVAEASGRQAIANLSFDLTQVNPDGSVSTRYQLTTDEQTALAAAEKAGIPVFVSIGNEAKNRTAWEQADQQFDNLVVIGGAEGRDRASTSSYGNHLDLLAPNRLPNHSLEGTSLATAYATGVASQVWAENPELSDRQLERVLKSTATDLNTPGRDAETGFGLLNPTAAMQWTKQITGQSIEIIRNGHANETWQGIDGVIASERPNALLEGTGTGTVSTAPEPSRYQGMSANAAEHWIEADEMRYGSADAAAAWHGEEIRRSEPSPYKDMSARAAEHWIENAPDPATSSVPHLEYERGVALTYDPAVKQWQQRMQELGYKEIKADGLYGPQSEQVARQFQEAQGLAVDGIVGPDTWNAAFADTNEPSPLQPISIAAIDHATETATPAELNPPPISPDGSSHREMGITLHELTAPSSEETVLFHGSGSRFGPPGFEFSAGVMSSQSENHQVDVVNGHGKVGLFEEDGNTRHGFKTGVGVVTAKVNLLERLQESGRIPESYVGDFQFNHLTSGGESSVGDDGFTIGAGASLFDVAVTGGTSDTESNTDGTIHGGIGLGVGAALRGHWDDIDSDGFREFGGGFDYSFASVDATTEDPLRTAIEYNTYRNPLIALIENILPEENLTEGAADFFGFSIQDRNAENA